MAAWLALLLPATGWACPNSGDGVIVGEPHEYGDSGFVAYFYDVDGDGLADRAQLYQPDGEGGLETWPLLYLEGLIQDGNSPNDFAAEEVWIDPELSGLCWKMHLYWKRTVSYSRF